ncbi:MAG: twin-arginine translocation signal domain-containing protein [Verrucomicrobia bacterium]|jgi:hypothetical protein|nr:twin-arginine translocation signal domain-containing protein [Verrucomicrobiota bacterium]
MHLSRRDFLKASAAVSDGPGLQVARTQWVKCRPAPFMGRPELPSKPRRRSPPQGSSWATRPKNQLDIEMM